MELVQAGIRRRMTEVVDTALQTYAADARGYVYFLLDAPELERQTLVRTDQVAVEVYWQAPNDVRQRIVGMRQEEELPVTRLYYYLDRLTVVQDNYDQGIVIADGENVNDVPHPVGEGAEKFYEYRLVDSLTLRLPGVPDPVRVNEIQVRPRKPDIPAVIGSVFLEEATGALVRMNFTFTPSAYTDPRLDFINVTLENGLWQGRYWLPYEQRLEIRREIPELDLPFGTIIRTRMRIGDYRFNEPVPEWLFVSNLPVTMAPRAQRESFPFEAPIDAEWRLEGIGEPLSVAELRAEARTLVRDEALSGLADRRFGAGSASDVFRFNRAEGVVLGFGLGLESPAGTRTRLHGGWAFGARHPLLSAEITGGDQPSVSLHGYVNRSADVGGSVPAAGLTSSLGALVADQHWTDPFHASGANVGVGTRFGTGWSARLEGRAERQRSAELTSTFALLEQADGSPTVRPVDEGTHLSTSLVLRRESLSAAGGWWVELRGSAGRLFGELSDFDFGRAEVAGGYGWTRSERRAAVDLTASGGIALGDLPRQELTLLGGRGSLPGYAHRGFGGDRSARAALIAAADVAHPWVRLRLLGHVGWTGVGSAGREALNLWGARTTGQLLPSAGIGLGVFYDILRIDLVRGLGEGGRTELIVEVQPAFWGFL